MSDDDRFPRYSYDLVDFLDAEIHRPTFPVSANAFANMDAAAVRSAAFTAGARSVVDMLVAWREEEIEDAEAINTTVGTDAVHDDAGGAFPRIFDADGSVRGVISSLRVAGDGTRPELDGGD